VVPENFLDFPLIRARRAFWYLVHVGWVAAGFLTAEVPGVGPVPTAVATADQPLRWVPKLPPAPEGVTDMTLLELLNSSKSGAAGYSEKASKLNGKQVRITGYMVKQAQPTPWVMLFSPVPQSVHEREYGLCDDLPVTTIHVRLPKGPSPFIPFQQGLVAITGTLELGAKEEADDRTSIARLIMPPGKPSILSITNFVTAPVTTK
jgi:hypothetical protein